MRKLKFISVILLLTAVHVDGDAQSLQALIDTAMNRNLEIKYRHGEYLAALERVPQVNRLPDPEVGVGGFLLPVETRVGAQRFRLSAAQMSPWFGTLQAREDLVLAQAETMYQPIAIQELELAYEVKTAYYRLYEISESQEIIGRSLRVLELLRQFILGRIESGQGSTADVLRLDLKVRELEQQLRILETERERPLADLNQILNRPVASPVNAADTFTFAEIPVSRDTLLSHVMQYHPAIRMHELQQQVSRRAIDLNEKDRKPSLGVGMDYIFVTPRTDAEPEHNGRDILQVKAMISVPIYGEKYAAKEREEQLRIEALESRKLDLATAFVANIDKALADHEAAQLKYELYTGQIGIAESALRILETDYSTSGNDFDELLRLEMELIDYDLKIIKAVVESHLAIAAIEKYLNNLN